MFNATGKVFGVTGRTQCHLRNLVLRRGIMSELAVKTPQLASDFLCDRGPHFLCAGNVRRQFNRDGQVAVTVTVLSGLHHELTSNPSRNRRQLQSDGNVLRVNVCTKVGYGELRTPEYVHKW